VFENFECKQECFFTTIAVSTMMTVQRATSVGSREEGSCRDCGKHCTTASCANAFDATTAVSFSCLEEPSPTRPLHQYYFGYGAMCNPKSRARRKIEGVNFWPALLPNHRIDFSNAGAASVVETGTSKDGGATSSVSAALSLSDEGVHGVLMEFSAEEMWERTQKSEKGYNLKQVWVYPYRQDREEDQPHESSFLKPVLANVFYFSGKAAGCEGIPQERYLKVISDGMRHHNVCSDYIHRRILSAKCTPVRKPCDYLLLPRDAEPLPTITYHDYVHRAITCTKCFLLGDAIVDLVGDLPEENAPLMKFLTQMFIGKRDILPHLKEIFYDPDVMDPDTGYCFTQDSFSWQKWAENQLSDIFNSSNLQVRITRRLAKEQ
jgi:hypothetical protein